MQLFICTVEEDKLTEIVRAASSADAVRMLLDEFEFPMEASRTITTQPLDGTIGIVGRGKKKVYRAEWNKYGCKQGVLVTGHEAKDLSQEDAAAALQAIVDVMYHEGPNTAWDSDTIDEVAHVLHKHKLVPKE